MYPKNNLVWKTLRINKKNCESFIMNEKVKLQFIGLLDLNYELFFNFLRIFGTKTTTF